MSLFQLIEANQEQMDKITERFNERLDKVFRKINRMAQAEIVAYDIDDTLEFDLIWADILEESGYNNLVQRYVNTLDDMQGSINKILDEAGLLETLSKDQINRLRAVKELQIKDLQKIGTDAGLSLKKSLYNNVLAGKSKSELLEAMEGELAGTRYQSYAKTYASTGISDYRQAVINQRTEEFADDEDVVWVYEGNDADKVTRDFCRHILKANKAYDKGEKDKLESDKRRKWNCRHMFVPMYKEDAIEAGYEVEGVEEYIEAKEEEIEQIDMKTNPIKSKSQKEARDRLSRHTLEVSNRIRGSKETLDGVNAGLDDVLSRYKHNGKVTRIDPIGGGVGGQFEELKFSGTVIRSGFKVGSGLDKSFDHMMEYGEREVARLQGRHSSLIKRFSSSTIAKDKFEYARMTFQHEAWHKIDADNGLHDIFYKKLIDRGIRKDKLDDISYEVSYYAMKGGTSELFAEVGALYSSGNIKLIPKELLEVFEETIEKVRL